VRTCASRHLVVYPGQQTCADFVWLFKPANTAALTCLDSLHCLFGSCWRRCSCQAYAFKAATAGICQHRWQPLLNVCSALYPQFAPQCVTYVILQLLVFRVLRQRSARVQCAVQ
jgi:hypothetical protein